MLSTINIHKNIKIWIKLSREFCGTRRQTRRHRKRHRGPWTKQEPKWKKWIGVTKVKPCQPGAGGVVGVVVFHKLKLKKAVHANCTMDMNLMHRLTHGNGAVGAPLSARGAVGAPLSSPAIVAANKSLQDTQDMELQEVSRGGKLCRGSSSSSGRRRRRRRSGRRRSSRVPELKIKAGSACQ